MTVSEICVWSDSRAGGTEPATVVTHPGGINACPHVVDWRCRSSPLPRPRARCHYSSARPLRRRLRLRSARRRRATTTPSRRRSARRRPSRVCTTSRALVGLAALGADRKLYYYESDISSDELLVTELACLGGQAKDGPAVVATQNDGRAFFVPAPNGDPLPALGVALPGLNYSSIGAFTPVNNAS